MKCLFILNDPPYGTERSYNALRLAASLARREGEEVRLFLIGDAAVCGTCMDARGMADADLAAGARRGSTELLGDWTVWADKVLVF
ncbi:MAG TPA: DsrE family protein [Burkholderiales bacterium]|nr:DsrE family protein [Burkholderiales bacterium]